MNSNACKLSSFVIFIIGYLLTTSMAFANIRLPHFFGEHMVLQQEMPIKIWGWSEPGERVTVEFGDSKGESQADASGYWAVELPAMKASKQPKLM